MKRTYSFLIIRITLLVLTISLSEKLIGQPYEHSGGVRAGYSSGLTYKGFLRYQMAAFELDALYNRHGLNLSVLYEHHMEPFRSSRWLIYLGGGAFSGKWEEEFSVGLAAVGGIEYMVRDLPLNFSLDWKPMINILRVYELDFLDFGVSIRYRFNL